MAPSVDERRGVRCARIHCVQFVQISFRHWSVSVLAMLLFYCFRVVHMGIAVFRVHGVYRDLHCVRVRFRLSRSSFPWGKYVPVITVLVWGYVVQQWSHLERRFDPSSRTHRLGCKTKTFGFCDTAPLYHAGNMFTGIVECIGSKLSPNRLPVQ